MNRHLEGGSSDYSKMTKAELIDWAQGLDSRIDNQYVAIKELEAVNDELKRSRKFHANWREDIQNEYDALLHSAPTYRPGWWLGVALFAAILIPWVLFGIWVMS